jgi:dTDP-4-amino-4,6-dideoxygalactose transaminase
MTDLTVREIPFSRPEFDDAEAKAVSEVLASGWVSQGPKVARFEELFAERVGARFGIATTSCTTALHLALILAGVGPGDEVICPSYSFIATGNAVLYAGGTPVFADIEPDTWNIDPADALARVTPKTRAVIPAHQVGLAADLDRFKPFAARGIAVVEDAACATGSTYRGRPIGSYGNIACFSFHPRKTISLGEGGLITTDDPAVAEHARRLRSHGASVSDHARHQAKGLVFEEYRELGYNYRMTDLQAAVGIEQLKKLDRLLARRRAVADRYNTAFAPLPQLQIPARPAYADHAYQSYAIRLLPDCRVNRDDVLRELVGAGVSCRRGIPPMHLEPLYRNRGGRVSLPVSEEVAARSIFLPIFSSLPDADQTRIIDAVVRIVTRS